MPLASALRERENGWGDAERREEDVSAGWAKRPIGLEEKVGVPVEFALAPSAMPRGQRQAIG